MRIIIITLFLLISSILNAQPYRLRLDSLKIDYKLYLDGIDRMPFFEGLGDSNLVHWNQLSDAVKQQLGAGTVYNAPDDLTLELKIEGSDTTIGIKDEGVFGSAFSQSAIDTIMKYGGDSISVVNDTIALQEKDLGVGGRCFLKQLSTGNKSGAGMLVGIDSSDFGIEPNSIVIFDNPNTDVIWVRDEFLQFGIINVLAAGAKGDSINDDTQSIQACMDLARDLQIDITDNYTGFASDRRVIRSPKIIIPFGKKGKYRITSPITIYNGQDIEFQKSALVAGTQGMVMVTTLHTSAGNPVATYGTRNLRVKDMILFGNGLAEKGLFLRNTGDGSTISNLAVYGVKGKTFADGTRECDIPDLSSNTIIVDNATGLLPNQIIEIENYSGFFVIETISGTTVTLNRNISASGGVGNVSEFYSRPTGLQIGRCIGLNIFSPEVRLNTLGVYVGDDSTVGRSAKVQFYGAFIEDNDYGLLLDRADACSFYGPLVQHSRRGWDICITNGTWNNDFYSLYCESINSDTLDTYGTRTFPVIDILWNSFGTSFHNLRYPQNPSAVGWRRLMRNYGENTFVSGLKVTDDDLIENPSADNDYALIEQNQSNGTITVQSSSGSANIHNPYLYVVGSDGSYPNDRASVSFQWANGQRLSGRYNFYSDTGSDPLLSFYKSDTTWTSTAARLYLAINGLHLGHDDISFASTRIYSDATNRVRLETGDTFYINTSWDGGQLRLDSWRMWEDEAGYLRAVGTGDPASDSDGYEFFLGDSIRSDADSVYIYIHGKYSALELKAIP